MKSCRFAFTLLAGLAIGCATPAIAEQGDHHHHEEVPLKLELDHGRKWPTDAPLRAAMNKMRAALTGKLHAIHGGKLGTAGYAALGRNIERQIGAIVSQCTLEPKPDAMLHVVIAELVGAADVMQGKAAGDAAAAAHRTAMALNDYGRYFSHPGWQPLE